MHDAPPDPVRDPARLAAVRRTDLLNEPRSEPLDRLTRMAARLIGAPVSLVSLLDADRQVVIGHEGLPEPLAAAREVPLSHSFCRHVVVRGADLVIRDAREHPLVRDNPAVAEHGVIAYAGTPVTARDGAVLGAFCVIDGQPRDWTAEQVEILRELARSATTEMHLRQALREELLRSRTDPLTGLENRRAFMEALDAHVSGAVMAPLGLLMVDIDHFKGVNDRHGHAAGDAVLVEVAVRLRGAAPAESMVSRWGGEEFAVLVPCVPDEDALWAIGEKLRHAVAREQIRVPREVPPVHVTVSVGCAHVTEGPVSTDRVIGDSDRALYAAKRRGRDRTMAASRLTAADQRAEESVAVRVARVLSRAASLREGVPELHCQQVADLSEAVARRLGLGEAMALRCCIGGWLHDLGKVAEPEAILAKPGPLTEEERAVMMAHPVIGAQLVHDLPDIAEAAAAIRHHHERFDGRGHPDGLAGEDIPIEARIVCATDAFSAMTNTRVYHLQMGMDEAVRELRRQRGAQFDPAVVDALCDVLEERDRRFDAARDAGVLAEVRLGDL